MSSTAGPHGQASVPPSTIFERTGGAHHQSLAHDYLAYCELVTTARSALAKSSVNTMRSTFVTWISAIQPCPMHYARYPKLTLVVGYGCTTRFPPPDKAQRRTRAPRSSTPSSRLVGRDATKPSQVAPAPPLTPRTALPRAPSSLFWIHPPTCPAPMLASVCRCNAATPVPTLTSMTTRRNIFQQR